MIFEDGTCPPLPLVRRFIRLAADAIDARGKCVAVHCKAGLGRTGCLIGAFLIYKHGFTANEVISFMRFMRPGMVVGPQQHWLHLNQGEFRQWAFEDALTDRITAQVTATATAAAQQQVAAAAAAAAAAASTSTPASLPGKQTRQQRLVVLGSSNPSTPVAQTTRDEQYYRARAGASRQALNEIDGNEASGAGVGGGAGTAAASPRRREHSSTSTT
ncbi:cell division control protein 14, partial [Ascosphaera acerosa]